MQLTHDEWLKARMRGIGGSDAAAIVGLNPWATPYTVWADKTGRTLPKEDNEVMRQGRDLEQYVADRWMEATGKRCRRRTKILTNDVYPFALANVDRWVKGDNEGLECKTTNFLKLKTFKNGEFPDTYYCQCMHYMAVTGASRWNLAVLVLGGGFYSFVIERDEAEIAALMETERHFWHEYVLKDTPPPVDGLEPTTETINGIYRNAEKEIIDLFGFDETIRTYRKIKAQIKDLEGEKEKLEQILKEQLKNAEIGRTDEFTVNWKQYSRSTFQTKAFAEDHPDMELDQYYKSSSYRKFEIKEAK